jgi:hypothetical protein
MKKEHVMRRINLIMTVTIALAAGWATGCSMQVPGDNPADGAMGGNPVDAANATGWVGFEMEGVMKGGVYQPTLLPLARGQLYEINVNLHNQLVTEEWFDISIEPVKTVGAWNAVYVGDARTPVPAGQGVTEQLQVTPGADAVEQGLRVRATGPSVETSLVIWLTSH